MKNYLRPCEFWDNWLKKTGEQPPDFDRMPSTRNLPDPLDLQARRFFPAWLEKPAPIYFKFIQKICDWHISRAAQKYHSKNNKIEKRTGRNQGSGSRAVIRPKTQGKTPFWNLNSPNKKQETSRIYNTTHPLRMVAYCSFKGVCSGLLWRLRCFDDTQAFKWSGLIMTGRNLQEGHGSRQGAWLAPHLSFVDKKHACITGHSRNGKLSLSAALSMNVLTRLFHHHRSRRRNTLQDSQWFHIRRRTWSYNIHAA